MIHHGSCHCGNISFEVRAEFTEALDCNCSLCRRRGGLLAFIARDKFTLTSDPLGLSSYMFNQHRLQHDFCAICGIAPFSEGRSANGHDMASINLRCIDDLDLGRLTIKKFDGKNHFSGTRAVTDKMLAEAVAARL